MKPFLLTSFFEDFFEYRENTLHLDLSFDNVLRVFELFKDDAFHEYEKVDITLEMLVKEYRSIADIDFREKYTLFLYIFKEFLDMDLEQPSDVSQKRLFDFEQDAGIIYASFLRSYQMDLFEQQGKLHWFKFMQLLTHLDNKSKFKEVVGIREAKIPVPDKYNKEQREYLIRMKRAYALDTAQDEATEVKMLDDKFDALALMLRG